jgi:hypothetical protein
MQKRAVEEGAHEAERAAREAALRAVRAVKCRAITIVVANDRVRRRRRKRRDLISYCPGCQPSDRYPHNGPSPARFGRQPFALNLKLPHYEICSRTSFRLSAFAAGQAKRQIRPDGA